MQSFDASQQSLADPYQECVSLLCFRAIATMIMIVPVRSAANVDDGSACVEQVQRIEVEQFVRCPDRYSKLSLIRHELYQLPIAVGQFGRTHNLATHHAA
jgi:hypothetical protein